MSDQGVRVRHQSPRIPSMMDVIIQKRRISLLLAFIFSCSLSADVELFRDGKTEYSVVLPQGATAPEKTAAKELQAIIKEISGAVMPIVGRSVGKGIYIGGSRQKASSGDESFTYGTVGENLYIYGGSPRGTMYGVYRFLEKELGVRWYTSSYTKIPKRRRFVVKTLSHSEKPVINQRLDFYYEALRHHDWAAHNLLNTQYKAAKTAYGAMSSYWGIHTFRTLMPPSEYFAVHPEYYSVYKGKRSDKAQLCLSNNEMRRQLTANLLKVIAENPDYWCYDVSQNDNSHPCECSSCQQLVNRYGGQSGAMLWFVNQVAREVRKSHPDKYVGTFAYRYTRRAPKSSIRPAENVVIRLCDIECCMAHPLERCEKNKSFLSDMNAWRKITKNIYIWDYTTGFPNYLLPFPNFSSLAENIRYFSRHDVIGIMEEGAHNVPWNEFSELKQWIVAKLLWNPNQDVDSLVTQFVFDYYGKAAPYIKRYYDLCNRQVSDDIHFTIKQDWNSAIFDDAFMDEGMKLMKKALSSAPDAECRKRVSRVAAQLYYLRLRRDIGQYPPDSALVCLKSCLDSDPTNLSETGLTLERVLKEQAQARPWNAEWWKTLWESIRK